VATQIGRRDRKNKRKEVLGLLPFSHKKNNQGGKEDGRK
jgi:hypothetical protein